MNSFNHPTKLRNLSHIFISKNEETDQFHVYILTPLAIGTRFRPIGCIWEEVDQTTIFLEVVDAPDSTASFDFRRVDIDQKHYTDEESVQVIVETEFGMTVGCTTVPIAKATLNGPSTGMFAPGAIYERPFPAGEHSIETSSLIPLVPSSGAFNWCGVPICTKKKGVSTVEITAFSMYDRAGLADLKHQLKMAQPMESEQKAPDHVIHLVTTMESNWITADLPVLS